MKVTSESPTAAPNSATSTAPRTSPCQGEPQPSANGVAQSTTSPDQTVSAASAATYPTRAISAGIIPKPHQRPCRATHF